MKITGDFAAVACLSHHADGRGRRPHDLPSGDAPVPALHVGVPADPHVEAAVLELAVLLGEGAEAAEEVDAAVAAGLLREPVLLPQLGTVAAGVEAGAYPRRHGQQHVERPARTACWEVSR